MGENPAYAGISGHVSTNGGGAPLSTIRVTAYNKEDDSDHWRQSLYDYTHANGDYQFFGLLPDVYKLKFEDIGYNDALYFDRYYQSAAELEGATPITVTEGAEIGGIDITLASDGIISGTVTSFDGRPLYRNVHM